VQWYVATWWWMKFPDVGASSTRRIDAFVTVSQWLLRCPLATPHVAFCISASPPQSLSNVCCVYSTLRLISTTHHSTFSVCIRSCTQPLCRYSRFASKSSHATRSQQMHGMFYKMFSESTLELSIIATRISQ